MVGVLLVNLGTPDAPDTASVRRYLREFLMDGRVIDIPYPFRFLLVNGIIAPFRAPKSAKIYQQLWEERGSPLKFYGEDVCAGLQEALGSEYVVKLAMRYQNPDLSSVLAEMEKLQLDKLIIIPLFPQYASATTGSVYERVMELMSSWQVMPTISLVSYFYQHPRFAAYFADRAKKYQAEHDFDYYLFSYHGVPERHIKNGDITKNTCVFGSCCEQIGPKNHGCYRAQCFETTRLIAKQMGLKEGTYATAFQSRLGRDPWLQPYTDDTIKRLVKEGKKKILAFSPAFVADCLETTIEVGEEYKELFEEAGGEHWQLVESLNNSPEWIHLLKDLVHQN
ncbi:ferrochelatase [Aquirufa rosea]|uniref:Ferrochelatase n=1 Tax=Aquirufa rosea TaxID=2509241 RepID=A0A4Q1C341_9BACT|nr:ferrochelatase [Aquirufa rosea]RXK52545.1 ferrochelatase [Aquirufa rosea]